MNSCQVGIASSVAKAFGYDLQKTILFARELQVSLIQLYLPSLRKLHDYFSQFKKYADSSCAFVWHLPPITDSAQFEQYLKELKKHLDVGILIQHERLLNGALSRLINKSGYTLGLENDDAVNYKESFLLAVKQYYRQTHQDLAVVLDVSRYFHQRHQRYSSDVLICALQSLFDFCKTNTIDLIFHVIDHKTLEAGREHWTPLFDGDIPYVSLFDYIRKKNIPLKSCIFEYEDYEKTRLSVQRLISFMVETK